VFVDELLRLDHVSYRPELEDIRSELIIVICAQTLGQVVLDSPSIGNAPIAVVTAKGAEHCKCTFLWIREVPEVVKQLCFTQMSAVVDVDSSKHEVDNRLPIGRKCTLFAMTRSTVET
jgi:hypothetical protein